MQIFQILNGCYSFGFPPSQSDRTEFVFGNPNNFQFIDPSGTCGKRKGGLFHLLRSSITASPERQGISASAEISSDSIGWYFTVDKAFLFPFGAFDLSSQEH